MCIWVAAVRTNLWRHYLPCGALLCSDVDECSDRVLACHGLDEICTNTAGSFRCDCAEGFIHKDRVCVKKQKPSESPDTHRGMFTPTPHFTAATHTSVFTCRCSGERPVWGHPGWWGGSAAADVLRGGALCSGHVGCQGRFGLHICIHGRIGSHGRVLAFWQGRPFVRQLLKGTIKLRTFHMADSLTFEALF